MICDRQIVVNGLGAADELLSCACQKGIVRELLDGIHGIIAADVNEYFDIQLVQKGKDLLIDGLVLMNARQLITAGAQVSGRCSL